MLSSVSTCNRRDNTYVGQCRGGLLWLGLFIDALATFAWGRALQLSEVGILSNFAYLTPVAVALLSYVALGEPIAAYSVIGMLLVLGGSLLRVIKIRWFVKTQE